MAVFIEEKEGKRRTLEAFGGRVLALAMHLHPAASEHFRGHDSLVARDAVPS